MYKLAEDDPNFIIEGMPPLVPKDASSRAATVFAILDREPAALVEQILAARQWAWRDDVLALCSAERRQAIAAAPLEQAPVLLEYVLRPLASEWGQEQEWGQV